MRKSLTAHRLEIAALKREVKSLTSQLKAAQRQVKAPAKAAAVEEVPARKGGRKWVFKPEALAGNGLPSWRRPDVCARLRYKSRFQLFS